jgi:hypothetical protein
MALIPDADRRQAADEDLAILEVRPIGAKISRTHSRPPIFRERLHCGRDFAAMEALTDGADAGSRGP